MPKPYAESTRRRIIKASKSRYEDELVGRTNDWKAQRGAASMANIVAGSHFVLGEEEEAREWYLKAAEAQRRYASMHPDWNKDPGFTANKKFILGLYLWRAGKEEEAREVLLSTVDTYVRLLEAAASEYDRERSTSAGTPFGRLLVKLTYVHLFAGDFETAYSYAKRRHEHRRRDLQMLRKWEGRPTRSLPRPPPSVSVRYNLCKAIVEKDPGSLALAKKGLSTNIRYELRTGVGRMIDGDLLVIAERAEKELF